MNLLPTRILVSVLGCYRAGYIGIMLFVAVPVRNHASREAAEKIPLLQ